MSETSHPVRLPLERNADFQSALSQFCKLVGHPIAWDVQIRFRFGNGDFADYKSAVQPIKNLRHFGHRAPSDSRKSVTMQITAPPMRRTAGELIKAANVIYLSPRERVSVREGEARELHKANQTNHLALTLPVKIRQQFAFKNKFFLTLFPIIFLCLLLGCQTTRLLPSVDFQEPGWQVRRGMAVWQPNKSAPELAGDFLLARHTDGRVMAQFLKIPFPGVAAWREPGRWQIEFQPQNRRYAGRGNPPARLLFCHVADAAAGHSLPPALAVESSPAAPNQLRLRQRDSGEALTITWLP